MNTRVTRLNLLLLLSASLWMASCQKKTKGDDADPGAPSPVEIRFKHMAGSFRNLVYDSAYPVTPAGTPTFVKINTFKYYISNIQLVDAKTGDTVKIPDTYFLVDHGNAQSLRPQFMVPAGEYYNLSFLIGIDANRNFNGPKTGALDPALGMYWNATDGYIMAKMEGTSPSSTLPGNVFTFHVGGVKDPHSVLAMRHFKLGGNVSIQPNKKTVINISTDALAWFSNPHPISLSTPITGPGDLSNKMAENYFKMFDFISVTFE
ncbi:MAG TPA: MbnP family protein [Chitinophagaceae bacterium]|nr:MbnP family protein [Chitinophagaceae bacterium]